MRVGLCPVKALVWTRTILDTDRAGDGICGLCGVTYIPLGTKADAAGAYIDIVVIAGEPRSEIV